MKNIPSIETIEKTISINDYELEGYDEEGVIGEVNIYVLDNVEYHIVQWLAHSEKGYKKEILKTKTL